MLRRGELQEWRGKRSVMLTQINEYPQCKEAFCWAAAGDLEEIRELYPTVVEWAKAQGCTRAGFQGRPGWARTFLTADEGWHMTAAVFAKEL